MQHVLLRNEGPNNRNAKNKCNTNLGRNVDSNDVYIQTQNNMTLVYYIRMNYSQANFTKYNT